MADPSPPATLEAWVSEFAESPAYAHLSDHEREHADLVAREFLAAACARRGVPPEALDAEDVRAALCDHLPTIGLSHCALETVPAVVRALLESLELAGRLPSGRGLFRQAGALSKALRERSARPPNPSHAPPSPPPPETAPARSRNAPCPCGSGRKFKKCCGASHA